ncbi:hypothetical protein OS493_012858 [Desmophyllum pertusum]|uniref:Myb-like domain-containing protein n=1 Tax=Desmophyllum pertusum TaxID=174260 RepID=A0A9W9Z4P3_9CNID|nr:hypothetical protein OS493_012858 [Desmophyllum pertusum]
MEESEGEGECGKRPHVTTGNTPHKPEDKRRRSTGSLPRSAKKLSFPRSPSNVVKKSPLTRKKPLFSPLKELKNSKKSRRAWSQEEDTALVQFVALHKDKQATDVEWPAMKAMHLYWYDAAKYIKQTACTQHLRDASVVRQRVVNYMRQNYKTVEEAEGFHGLDVESYLNDVSASASTSTNEPSLRLDEVLASSIKSLTQHQLEELVLKALLAVKDKTSLVLKVLSEVNFSSDTRKELISRLYQPLDFVNKMSLVDKHFLDAAVSQGIDTNPADFASLSLGAMKVLQDNGKPNLIHTWSKCVLGENGKPLIPIHRMPFGLLQYQMQFFACTNVMQITEPEDYRSWRETMTTEFPGRFMRLFGGPMWSGQPVENVKDPRKARVNVACASQSTQWRRDKKSTFTSKPELQTAALDALKSANPDGRFWIKLDATDVKVALMESGRRVEWGC